MALATSEVDLEDINQKLRWVVINITHVDD